MTRRQRQRFTDRVQRAVFGNDSRSGLFGIYGSGDLDGLDMADTDAAYIEELVLWIESLAGLLSEDVDANPSAARRLEPAWAARRDAAEAHRLEAQRLRGQGLSVAQIAVRMTQDRGAT